MPHKLIELEAMRLGSALKDAGLTRQGSLGVLTQLLVNSPRQDQLTELILEHFDRTGTSKAEVRARSVQQLNQPTAPKGRSHLEKKIIRNVQGEKQTVWVNPNQGKEEGRNNRAKQFKGKAKFLKDDIQRSRRINQAVTKAVLTGDLPSRKQGARLLGDAAVDFLSNPVKAVRDGNRRENLARKLYQARTGTIAPTRLDGVRDAMRVGAKSMKETLKSPDTLVNTAGFVGSVAGGAVAGPGGAIAGDLAGALVTRKLIEAQSLLKAKKIQNASDLKNLVPAGKKLSDLKDPDIQMQVEKDLVGDVSGWAIGNGAASAITAALGRSIPLSGAVVAMAGVPTLASPVSQRAHDLVREGMPAATAARTAFKEHMELGDKREREWRSQFKKVVVGSR